MVSLNENLKVKVIAGTLGQTAGRSTAAAPIRTTSTCTSPGRGVRGRAARGHNAFLYVYEGEALVGEERKLLHRAAGLLSDGDEVRIEAGEDGARVLLLAGRPLREPVVQYGPFVMNTREEIEQAIADYQAGVLSNGEIGRIKIG